MTETQSPIDIGITRGGAKEQYLNLHVEYMRARLTLITTQPLEEYATRCKALTRQHISMLANVNKQNELLLMLDEKIKEETELLCKSRNIQNPRSAPPDIIRDATDAACCCVVGMITLYMDQFIGLEERYDIMLG